MTYEIIQNLQIPKANGRNYEIKCLVGAVNTEAKQARMYIEVEKVRQSALEESLSKAGATQISVETFSATQSGQDPLYVSQCSHALTCVLKFAKQPGCTLYERGTPSVTPNPITDDTDLQATPKKRYRLDIDVGAGGATQDLPLMDASLNREYERLVADIAKKDDKIEKQAIEITKKSAENDKLTTKNEAMKEIKAQNERLTLENKALIDVAKSGSNPEIHRRSDNIAQCMQKAAEYNGLKETSTKREIEQEERFKNKYNTLEKEHEARYNALLKEFENFKMQQVPSNILEIELRFTKERADDLERQRAEWGTIRTNIETMFNSERDRAMVLSKEVNVLQKQLNQLDRDDLLGKTQLLTAERDNMEPRVKAAEAMAKTRVEEAENKVKVLEADLAESKRLNKNITINYKELNKQARQYEDKAGEHLRAKADTIKENEHLKKVIADLEAKATAQAKQTRTQLSENSQLKDKIKQLEELNESGEITVGWAAEAKATIATLQEVCTIIISRCCGL